MLYETTDKPIKNIAETLSAPFSIVYGIIRREYSKEYQAERKSRCYRNSKLGSKNPYYGKFREDHSKYKGEISDGKGYILILKPDWFTGRRGSKHVFLHHLVVCEHLGLTKIPEGHCVHHKDQNPLNNSVDNLELLTFSEHSTLHHGKGVRS